jgi:DNA polymerase/3'-5' exonuclease PolX
MPSPPIRMAAQKIADCRAGLAQLLAAGKQSAYKIKEYQRAAAKIGTLLESVAELVREDSDPTVYAGIGEAISRGSSGNRSYGTLEKLERLGSQVPPEIPALKQYPRSKVRPACI